MFGWFRSKPVEIVIKGPIHIKLDVKIDGSQISQINRSQVCQDTPGVYNPTERSTVNSKDNSRGSKSSILPTSIGDDFELPEVEFGEEVK